MKKLTFFISFIFLTTIYSCGQNKIKTPITAMNKFEEFISKEKLSVQLKKLLYAFLPEKIVDKMVEVGKLTHKTFTNFFTYQCIECLILGSMFFVTMVILKIPYALLISVMITIMALIPIFGLCIAFIIASILIVMVNPIKVMVGKWFGVRNWRKKFLRIGNY